MGCDVEMSLKQIFFEFGHCVAAAIVRNSCKIFWVNSVKINKVYCEAYSGTQYACSPRYISEYIKAKYGDRYDIVWGIRDPKKITDPGVRAVRFISFSRLYEFTTAHIIISNCGMPSYLPKRKEQIVINTWHAGGAYKYCGADYFHSTIFRNAINDYKQKNTSMVLSSCRVFSEKVIPDVVGRYKGNILKCGLPRNDIFFSSEYKSIRSTVRRQFGIKDEIVVLYAPTFRGSGEATVNKLLNANGTDASALDTDELLHAVEKRFDQSAKMFYRAHRALKNDSTPESIVDVTDYSDMQKLLCATDVLISDYSSCIWDYSFMKKPCFLYVPDLDYYKNKDRGFYTPIEMWPGIIAQSNEELRMAVLGFDEVAYRAKVDKHHQALGSYENGTACSQVYENIAQECAL